jgi:Cu(I)/Ag(I) efflux system membrane fusion protein
VTVRASAILLLATVSSVLGLCQQAPDHKDHGAHRGHGTSAPSAPRATNAGAGQQPAPANAPAPGTTPQGYGHVELAGQPLSEIGYRTARTERRALTRTVRTSGWVTVDETRTSHVHAKVRGYVTSSHDRFIGSTVKRGDPLVSLYSEGVLAAELELLALVDQKNAIKAAAPDSPASRSLDAVIDAARRRFSLMDVSRGQVSRVEKTGKPTKGVTLSSPRDGVVLARAAIDGVYVEPTTELFVISDVSRLWVIFDVFESDMPYVALGQQVSLRCEGVPHAHDATVSFIAPAIDPATRSLRARVEVDNQRGHLRPGAFSTISLDVPIGAGIVVPEDAVLRTGKRDLVFVVKDGMAIPTEVTLGPKAGGMFRVDAGLEEGAEVVTGAQFLIDSESRLRAAGPMGGGHGAH